MSIRRILARIDGSDGDLDVLKVALAVARAFDAHIEAVHIKFDTRDLPLVTGYGPVEDLSVVVESLERTAAQSLARARQHFDDWRQSGNVPLGTARSEVPSVSAAWVELAERETQAVARLGQLVDLIIIEQPGDRNGFAPLPALEAAIFETRRPVLMVPPSPAVESLLHCPVVAWNGSPEAALALYLALPLLKKADGAVGVFAAAEPKQRGSADDVIVYLDWHGIAAEPMSPDGIEESLGASLLVQSEVRRAGLIVMGAYTHSRVQLLLGGVTRHVFRHAKTPVLLAH